MEFSISFLGTIGLGFIIFFVLLILAGFYDAGRFLGNYFFKRKLNKDYPYLAYQGRLLNRETAEKINQKHKLILASSASEDIKTEINNLLNVLLLSLLEEYKPIQEADQQNQVPNIPVNGALNTQTYAEIMSSKISQIIKYLKNFLGILLKFS